MTQTRPREPKHIAILPGQHIRPRRSLGQNFLRDENISRKIVASVAAAASDIVLEIGPGEGALTRYLARTVNRLIAVDIDERVVSRMRAELPAIELIHGDFLQVDLAGIAHRHGSPLRVVGNIPYNITTPILFHILDSRTSVRDATLMVQREVAQRLIARPGSKEYGILSVSFQVFAEVKPLFTVARAAFYPRPDVMSSVVRLVFLPAPRYSIVDEQLFRTMVRAIFGKRRKMLRTSLKYFCDEHGYHLPGGVDLTRRPEDLDIRELVDLSNALVATSSRAR